MVDHVVILGAGISGLATAWFLRQSLGSQVKLTILEKSQRAGGWIQTLQVDNFLFEQGPRSCRSRGTGSETLALSEALGLQDHVILPHSDARNRYLYYQKRLQRFPKHLWEIPFSPLMRGWGKALWRDWWMPKRQREDENIQDFFSRRLGQPWVERLIDPFVLGIYAGNCQQLSLKSCFPLFDQWEQQQGSLVRGAWRHRSLRSAHSPFVQAMQRASLFSFKGGLETLIRALAHELRDCLSLGQTVCGLTFHSGSIEVNLADGKRLKADRLISTLPAFVLSELLAPYSSVSTQLKELAYASLIVMNIGFHQPVLPFKGFGYLVPSVENSSILGCVWDSCVFPQQNAYHHQTRLTVMIRECSLSEQTLIEQTLATLHQHLGIRLDPQVIQIKRVQQAIPQYEVGYQLWKQELQVSIQALSPHFLLSGSAFGGVSVNDCIAQARQLASF